MEAQRPLHAERMYRLARPPFYLIMVLQVCRLCCCGYTQGGHSQEGNRGTLEWERAECRNEMGPAAWKQKTRNGRWVDRSCMVGCSTGGQRPGAPPLPERKQTR